MNLFQSMKRSKEKTEIMRKMINVLDVKYYDEKTGTFNENAPTTQEKENVYKEFYNFISNDEILGEILKEYDVTFDNFKFYIDYILSTGYGWYNGRYVPVDVFSFEKELRFFLSSINSNQKIESIMSDIARKRI